jgi:hypothetical protein
MSRPALSTNTLSTNEYFEYLESINMNNDKLNHNRQNLETKLHQACYKILKKLESMSNNNFIAFHTPNQGKRDIKHLQFLKTLGLVAGVPDLLIIKTSKIIGIEFKAPEGTLTFNQKLFKNKFQKIGHKFYVIKTIKEFYLMLNSEELVNN